MRKFVVTTALALVLAGSAYAQGNHGGGGGGGGGHGGGGGGGFAAAPRGGGGGGGFGGGGGPGPSFGAQRGPSGPSMGNHGPTGNVYNRAPAMNARENNGANRSRFTERNHGELYNRYEGENRNGNREGNRFGNNEGNRFNGRNSDHRGVVSGNFFEHGRHFGFRRFFNGEWVFLTDWDSCTAWAWVNVAPGAWAWRPVDVCIG